MNKRLTAKETAVIEYYTDPASDTRNNWVKSYMKAGYSECKGWRANAFRVHAKDYIKEAIWAKRKEFGGKIDVTREYLVDKLLSVIETGNNRDIISAALAIGDFTGMLKQKGPNPEAQAQKQAKSAEEQRLWEEFVRKRTAELSRGPKIVKVG